MPAGMTTRRCKRVRERKQTDRGLGHEEADRHGQRKSRRHRRRQAYAPVVGASSLIERNAGTACTRGRSMAAQCGMECLSLAMRLVTYPSAASSRDPIPSTPHRRAVHVRLCVCVRVPVCVYAHMYVWASCDRVRSIL